MVDGQIPIVKRVFVNLNNMSERINVEAILKKTNPNLATEYSKRPELKAAIKEIVELTIDKVKQKATTCKPDEDLCSNCYGTSGHVDKDSIEQVKQLIDYE